MGLSAPGPPFAVQCKGIAQMLPFCHPPILYVRITLLFSPTLSLTSLQNLLFAFLPFLTPSVLEYCPESILYPSFSIDTLKRSADLLEEKDVNRRSRRRRHRPRSSPSLATCAPLDYQNDFPSLVSTPSIGTSTPKAASVWSYSEVAARQFCVAPLASPCDDFPSTLVPFIPVCVVDASREKNNARAVKRWLAPTVRTPLRHNASVRSSFDKLFSNRPMETRVEPQVVQQPRNEQLAGQFRKTLAQVNNTRLLLPDYHLIRLLSARPEYLTLINQPKSSYASNASQSARNSHPTPSNRRQQCHRPSLQ